MQDARVIFLTGGAQGSAWAWPTTSSPAATGWH